MSTVSIFKSYAVLVDLEGYIKGKAKVENEVKQIEQIVDLVLRLEQARIKKEETEDMSQSARLEKERMQEQEGAKIHNRVIKKVLGKEATAEAAEESNDRRSIEGGKDRSLTSESHGRATRGNVELEAYDSRSLHL